MELIIFLIFIVIAVSNSKKAREQKGGDRRTASVWDNISSDRRTEQLTKGIRDLEDAINSMKNKNLHKAKQQEEAAYQKEQQERRRKEQEAKKRLLAEEQRKRTMELRKKQEEQRRKAEEKEKKVRAEQELLERCQNGTADNNVSNSQTVVKAGEKKETVGKKTKADQSEYGISFRTEEYLDPLTSSFYPDVDDYLFPTIASFYPNVELLEFSLQNPPNVL